MYLGVAHAIRELTEEPAEAPPMIDRSFRSWPEPDDDEEKAPEPEED